LIAGATSSIHLQTFVFASDETGWQTARMLAARARQGVRVRVLYDVKGSEEADPAIFAFMRDAGVEVRGVQPEGAALWASASHEKVFVVDGRVAILGGMNVADEYAFGGTDRAPAGYPGGFRDVDALVEGPSVHDAQQLFASNWADVGDALPRGEMARLFPALAPLAQGTPWRVVRHQPRRGEHHMENLHYLAFSHAQRSITIENAYFVPSRALVRALVDAARRGVRVRVLTNSLATHDNWEVGYASQALYAVLLRAGVEIYESSALTVHAKAMVIDGELVALGSMNLNGRSRNDDSESELVGRDRAVAAAFEARFAHGTAPGRARRVESARASLGRRVGRQLIRYMIGRHL
jgi:cardiolipin synthase